MTNTTVMTAPEQWALANERYLASEFSRLRLLLQRRVLWLRHQWCRDPLPRYQGLVITDEQADWLLAGEDRDAEIHFCQHDPDAGALSHSLESIEQDLHRQAQALSESGTPGALDLMAQLFGLTAFERDVLLLCLAPEVDPAFARLYAYVQDDAARCYPTPHLAVALFAAGEERSARESFLPDRPLRWFRLVTLAAASRPEAALPARPLGLDERMVGLLQGVSTAEERLAGLLRPLPPPLLTSSHRSLVDDLAHGLAPRFTGGRLPVLNLTGPPGAGKRAVAVAVCHRLGFELRALDPARLPPLEGDDLPRLLEREAILSRLAFCLDTATLVPAERPAAAVDGLVEQLGALLVLGRRERWQTERELLAAPVPKPDAAGRRELWEQALPELPASLAREAEAVVQQFDFGPAEVVQAVVAAQAHASRRAAEGEAGLAAGDLWQACREQAAWHMDELAQRLFPCYTWDDIVLPEEVYRQLQEIAAQVAFRPLVYGTWGFEEKLSRGRGISALFAGPSGTGKTMAAEILAKHLDLDLYRIDLAGVVSKYIGETEKNLRKVFDAAERSGAILFFDEADALFGKRTEVKDSHDRYANIEVNYLLQRMEDYRGLAILATNRKSALDQAFLRRLRFLVDFPFPDADSRQRIWQRVFPRQAAVGSLDYTALARLSIPGGNIRNIALNAAFLAASEGCPIEMPHIMRAARREYVKIEKLMAEAEFGAYWPLVKT